MIYLNPGFCEIGLHGDLFSGVDVRIVSFLEGPLQFLELRARESGSDSTLFPLFRQHPVVTRIHFVRQSTYHRKEK
ncbi:uncharacterized protein TNCT_426081 [Trichonephila clavata]|uniref:Uncharacterized protein n=1 Tax=Trichonephila clavata TaxID=2740835 RepID=A0A8X6GXX3_TRICU|nr:uncharacterized protein TNCT_426081 [Trichonephila clavata]